MSVNCIILKKILPYSLEVLSLYGGDCLGRYPEGLLELRFGKEFNGRFNLPKNLKYLQFGEEFNQKIHKHKQKILPNSIIKLTFGNKFNKSIHNNKLSYLPNKLLYLKFGDNFNKSFNFLTNTIEYLRLGEKFNRKIRQWPINIVTINFCNLQYKKELPDGNMVHMGKKN